VKRLPYHIDGCLLWSLRHEFQAGLEAIRAGANCVFIKAGKMVAKGPAAFASPKNVF
jgi:hypothetical protein